MAFDTKYQGPVEIALADQGVSFGTCEINDDFGEVQSASITREADVAEFRKCNNDLKMVVATNHRFQFTFEVILLAEKPLPGMHDRVAFPEAGVSGRIANVVKRWSQNGVQMVSLTATSWDAFEDKEIARYLESLVDSDDLRLDVVIPVGGLQFAIIPSSLYDNKGFVDFGDGSGFQAFESHNDPELSHEYAAPGNYRIHLRGKIGLLKFSPASTPKIVACHLGDLGFESMRQTFVDCTSLAKVTGTIPPAVNDMYQAFRNCAITEWTIPIPDTVIDLFQAWIFCPIRRWDVGGFPNISEGRLALNVAELSVEETDRILIDTEERNTRSNVELGLGTNQYSAAGQIALNALVARGWTITTGGLAS